MTVRQIRDAVIASLEPRLPGAVFSPNKVPAGSRSYAVVYVALSRKNRTRFTSKQIQHQYTVTIHSVGADDEACYWVQERVDELTGRRLSIPGRHLHPVEYITGMPPDTDDDGPTPLVFSVSQFDILSDPI